MVQRGVLLRTLTAGVAVAAALALSSCGAASSSNTAPAGTPVAPESLTTISGQTLQVPSTTGPTALFFFTGECGTCVAGARNMAQAQASVGTQAQFLGVDMDSGATAKSITPFLDFANAATLPVTVDTSGALVAKYGVTSLGTVIVLTSAGSETYRAVDPEPDKISEALQTAGAS
jgi:hypothetical protein